MPSYASCLVVTGPPGAGKTTMCRRVAEEARARGRAVAGFVTERRIVNGEVAGRDVVDVATGARRALAEVAGPTDGPVRGRWHFHLAGFAFGAAICAAAPPAALLVVDELGPIELVSGLGWAPLVSIIRARPGTTLVVVRTALVETFTSAVHGRAVHVIDVDPERQDAAFAAALDCLGMAP